MSDPRPPRYLKPMNKVMMAVQKLGVPTGPAMVLTVPGRKSGKPRSTPMTPFQVDGDLYVVAGLSRCGLGRQRPGGRHRHAQQRPPVAAGPDRGTDCGTGPPDTRVYPVEVPVGVAFAKSSGMVVDGTPDEFEALAGRIAVFRFDLVTPG